LVNPEPAFTTPTGKLFHTWILNIGGNPYLGNLSLQFYPRRASVFYNLLVAFGFRLHSVLLGRFYSLVSETSALFSWQGVAATGGWSLDGRARMSRAGFLRHALRMQLLVPGIGSVRHL
jgi:hypothetical protein